MGKRRNEVNKILFGILKSQSIKVKALIGATLALCALVVLGGTVKRHDHMVRFIVVSEAFHVAGIAILLYKLFTKKTCSGLSLKSQELTALFFVVRLMCSSLMEGNVHTILDLLTLILTSLVIHMIRFKLKSSYIEELDNMRLSFVIVPCAVIAIFIHPIHRSHLTRILWAFSMYLESVSVLPQLRLMQNAKLVETFTGHYVFALGVSRFMSLAHWIIQMYRTSGTYMFLLGRGYFWFLAAFISEIIQSFILADFGYYYIKCFMEGQQVMSMPI